MTLTERYKKNYLPGFDCRMATFRNNLAYYGYSLSNGMTLGLSGCLSFIYSTPEKNRIPYYTILGVTDQSLEGLCAIFDTYLVRGECPYAIPDLTAFIKINLEKNILINAAVNRPLLNHIREGKVLKDFVVGPTNVGFHFVTITGLENGMITFFETDFSQPLEIDIETFIHLWFYDMVYGREIFDPVQLCNGKYYTIQPPGFGAQKSKHALVFSMDKVATSYSSDNKPYYHGLKGISGFFEDIKTWRTNVEKDCAVNSIFFMKILEMNLSGGGFGRRLYSSFLAESAGIIGSNELQVIGREFKATSKLWANFMNSICSYEVINKIRINEFDLLESLAETHSTNIINAEASQFAHLSNWIKSNN